MNLQKETKRWKGFLSTWYEAEPQLHQTNRRPIWKKNKATLWYYPAPKKRYKTPIYLIYSLVNQPFILDLYPGSSLIGAFVNEGFDVYLIDFGIPGYEDKDNPLDYYIEEYIQNGARQVLSHSGEKELTVMGFCLGGTLAAIYASIAEEKIKNLILDVAPIDFSHWTVLDQWFKVLKDEDLDFDEVIDAIGLIPSKLMESGVRLITAPVYFSPYLSLLNKAYNEQYVERWRLFNKWTKGHIPLPGAVLKQLVNEFVKHNKLVKGTLLMNNRIVNLANINCSLLVIASKYDRLVPIESTEKMIHLVSSNDKQFHVAQGGHATITIKGKLPDYLQGWLPKRSNPL